MVDLGVLRRAKSHQHPKNTVIADLISKQNPIFYRCECNNKTKLRFQRLVRRQIGKWVLHIQYIKILTFKRTWQTKSNFTDRVCQTDLKYSIFGGEKHVKKFFGKIDFKMRIARLLKITGLGHKNIFFLKN